MPTQTVIHTESEKNSNTDIHVHIYRYKEQNDVLISSLFLQCDKKDMRDNYMTTERFKVRLKLHCFYLLTRLVDK